MTTPPPTLSVVITCRDNAAVLADQLRALMAQDVDGWVDTVIVDDGSTDGTHLVAEEHADRLPGFRLIRTPPRGRAPALNHGYSASEGEAVVFLDADDEVAPGYLVALQRALEDHPCVAGRLDNDTMNPAWLQTSRPQEQVTGLRREPQVPWPVASGGTMAVRRDLLDAVGGFDEDMAYAQDTDLCIRIAHQGVTLTFAPEAVLRYRYRTSGREIFHQARHYGRGGVALDHRYGTGRPSAARIAVRSLRLGALVVHLPFCGRRSVRLATVFRAGFLIGWLESALWPRRFFPPTVLEPFGRDGPPATRADVA